MNGHMSTVIWSLPSMFIMAHASHTKAPCRQILWCNFRRIPFLHSRQFPICHFSCHICSKWPHNFLIFHCSLTLLKASLLMVEMTQFCAGSGLTAIIFWCLCGLKDMSGPGMLPLILGLWTIKVILHSSPQFQWLVHIQMVNEWYFVSSIIPTFWSLSVTDIIPQY